MRSLFDNKKVCAYMPMPPAVRTPSPRTGMNRKAAKAGESGPEKSVFMARMARTRLKRPALRLIVALAKSGFDEGPQSVNRLVVDRVGAHDPGHRYRREEQIKPLHR